MRNDFETNFLMHHGILGMKWGTRNGPPYPLRDTMHSAAEKAAGWRKSLKEKSEAKKKAKKRQAAIEKAKKTRAENERQKRLEKEYEEKKEKILKSGKASEVSKYKGQMTNKELSDALNRIRWEKELDGLAAAEVTSSFDKIDGVMKKVGTMTDWVNKGVNAYNAIDKAVKLVNGEEEEDRSFIEKIVDRGDLSDIKKYEKDMTAKEARDAYANYNTRKRIREEEEKKK